jgi:hypothetical protein
MVARTAPVHPKSSIATTPATIVMFLLDICMILPASGLNDLKDNRNWPGP